MRNAHRGMKRRHFIASAMTALAALGFSAGVDAQTTKTATAPTHILVVGDSLSAEYGLARGTGWVALLEQALQSSGTPATVTNASISGDTTSGGRSRLPALLKQHQPSIVIVELGGNDALRGLPLKGTLDNLHAMTKAAQSAGAKVLLLGIPMPPNYGPKFTQAFEDMYAQVAQESQAALVPSFLKGVADAANPTAYFQADRIHPNAQAQPIMLNNVLPPLRALMQP